MSDNCSETVDISDRIFEIEDTPHEYFVDLSVDAPLPAEPVKIPDTSSFVLKKEDKLFLDIIIETTRARTLSELYQIIVFSALGQTSSANGAIIVPAENIEGKWKIAEYHGLRLKNANISFRQKDEIFRRVVEANEIVEVGQYAKDPQCVTEYNKFRSLQATILIPFPVDGIVKFVLFLGTKITGESLSEKDYSFLKVLHQLIAALYTSIEERDRLRATVQSVTDKNAKIKHLEETLEKIRREQNKDKYVELIQHQMEFSGVSAYAFFKLDEINGMFTLIFNEQKDFLSLRRSSFEIDPESSLVSFFSTIHGHSVIENPAANAMLAAVFAPTFLTSINIFAVVPYFLADCVYGFLLCLRVDYELFLQNTEIIERLTRNVLQHEFARQSLVYKSRTIDTLLPLYSRLYRDIIECKDLGIPFGVVKFVFARSDDKPLNSTFLLNKMQAYLSKNEYIYRASFESFIVVLPGRKRSYVLKTARLIKRMLFAAGYESEIIVYHAETAAQCDALISKLF